MGFGYGAAIGAKLACPEDRVIHITGDGSFHMNLNEACTAVSQNLPIITVIMNNKVLGMVYQWQTIFYDNRYSNTTPERKTDFVKLGQAFGAEAYRAETPEELMQLIIEYIENGFVMKEKYKKDREKYFAYVDDNNSERIWNAIRERQW